MDKEKFKDIDKHKQISLDIILNQIASFDHKASVIVSILGILFALSFLVIEIIMDKQGNVKIYIFISFILFLISIISSLILAVLVLKPRKRKGKSKEKSLTYYIDLENMTEDEYLKILEKNNKNVLIFEQLNENARICHNKHKLLVGSIICMIPLITFFLLTTILIIWL